MIEVEVAGGEKRVVLMIEEFNKMKKIFEKFFEEVQGRCPGCGGDIILEPAKYPLWDDPSPTTGSGRCLSIDAPSCPKCNWKINLHGCPVADKGSYHYKEPEPETV